MHWADRGMVMAEKARQLFPPCTRIVLLCMADPYNPLPSGLRGTVRFVDDMGTVFPQWDNGSMLGVVYGADKFRKLTKKELEDEYRRQVDY